MAVQLRAFEFGNMQVRVDLRSIGAGSRLIV